MVLLLPISNFLIKNEKALTAVSAEKPQYANRHRICRDIQNPIAFAPVYKTSSHSPRYADLRTKFSVQISCCSSVIR